MIFYYSITGNTKKVADMVGKMLNQSPISIISESPYSLEANNNNEDIFFFCPVYFHEPPEAMVQFMKNLKLKEHPKIFLFLTCGFKTGSDNAAQIFNNILKGKGLELTDYYLIQLPDYFMKAMFPFLAFFMKKEKNLWQIALEQINQVVENIKNKTYIPKLPKKNIFSIYFLYKILKKRKHFSALSSCTGCGGCAKNCPMKAIIIEDKKPTWKRTNCILCVKCWLNCPKKAIKFKI